MNKGSFLSTAVSLALSLLVGTATAATPSPNNTIVMAGSSAAITDPNLNAWTITSGAQIAVNGTTIGFTSGVVEIALENGVLWQLNGAGDWYSLGMTPATLSGPTKASPVPAPVTPPPVSTALVPLGLWAGSWAQAGNLTAIMGRAPTYQLTYIDETYAPNGSTNNPGYNWPGQGAYDASQVPAGVTPVIGWPFGYTGGQGSAGTEVSLFSQIASGTYDTLIQGNLAAWKAAGFKALVLRPAWEMNGGWYAWSTTAKNLAAFQSAWKHFYTVVHAYAAANGMTVNVNWCPNVGPNQADTSVTIAQLYPGNAYVDSLGIDDYGNQAGAQYANAQATDTTGLQYLPTTMVNMGLADNKPVSGGEIGGNAAGFAQSFVALLAANPKLTIAFWCFWDSNTSVSGQGEWTAMADGLGANTPPAAPTAGSFAAYWAAGFGTNGSVRQ